MRQRLLDLGLGPARIAVVVEPAALGHDGRAQAVGLDAAAFADQIAAQVVDVQAVAHGLGQAGIGAVALLVAPAVEVEVHAGHAALTVGQEDRADVAYPDIVQRRFLEADAGRAAMVFGQAAFFGPAVHGDGLEGGDGAGDAAQRGLHVGRVILPDGLLGAEGDEGARLWRVLFGHVPALDGGAGGGACRPAPSAAAACVPMSRADCWRNRRRVVTLGSWVRYGSISSGCGSTDASSSHDKVSAPADGSEEGWSEISFK